MENGVMEKIVSLVMENTELRVKFAILRRMLEHQKAFAKERGYGASLDISDIEEIMGWDNDD